MDAAAFITKHEGVRYKVYRDSLGIPTIGVGFNLTRPDAAEMLKRVGAELHSVASGEELSAVQVNALLRADIQACTDDLAHIFTDFDKMPESVRMVLIDLRFNLGPVRFRGFSNTLNSFRRGDYRDAAKRLRISLWATQVGKRADEDIAMLEQEAKNHAG